jgi:D-alanyl-D-alanine carboxypeptidase
VPNRDDPGRRSHFRNSFCGNNNTKNGKPEMNMNSARYVPRRAFSDIVMRTSATVRHRTALSRVVLAFSQAAMLLLTVATLGAATAQPPGPLPLTPELQRRIDSLAHAALVDQHLAGFSLAIAHDGAIVYARGYGYRDLARRLPATPQTVYNIGSVTKQFTAAAVLLLAQRGKLTIDDPVATYLSGFPWGNAVTVRELLNHTSGIPDYLDVLDNNTLTMPKILKALRKARLKFVPGSKYEYSNSNYILLGDIVGRVSGVPYDDFVRRNIFQPLRLQATSLGTSPLDMPNGAIGYTVRKGRPSAVDRRADSIAILDFPDGGVNTTALDLVRWDTALDAGRLLNRRLLAMMFTPSHHRADWPYGYGFGVGLDRVDGHREIVHEGEWTGYAAENATFPDDGFDIVMLSNTDVFDENALKRRIFRLFYPPQATTRR